MRWLSDIALKTLAGEGLPSWWSSPSESSMNLRLDIAIAIAIMHHDIFTPTSFWTAERRGGWGPARLPHRAVASNAALFRGKDTLKPLKQQMLMFIMNLDNIIRHDYLFLMNFNNLSNHLVR
jgi:hypothetical protein